jgi:hypothetical protein
VGECSGPKREVLGTVHSRPGADRPGADPSGHELVAELVDQIRVGGDQVAGGGLAEGPGDGQGGGQGRVAPGRVDLPGA